MLVFYLIVLFSLSAQSLSFDPTEVRQLDRFTMGSCHEALNSEPFWPNVKLHEPQFFLWAGDAYYADTKKNSELKSKMLEAFDQVDYQSFRSEVPIIGTWDDHDYGWNNSDLNYPLKVASQENFLDFVEEPLDSLRRQQEGIYQAYSMGDVKLLLLDVRYFRLHKVDNEDRDMLGEAQWHWLENELKSSKAKIHFIVSGTTFHLPGTLADESWTQYPKSYARLAQILSKLPGVVLLSGDVHFTGFRFEDFAGRDVPEFHVSGMTHTASWAKKLLAPIHYRDDHYTFEKNFGEFFISREGATKLHFKARGWENEVLMDVRLSLQSDGSWLEVPSP